MLKYLRPQKYYKKFKKKMILKQLKDRAYYLPVLKQAKEINPGLKFIASAWSAPKWMKKSKSLNGELQKY